MYKSFFGLKENPFNVNPDPRFLYFTKQIEETLTGLMYGIQTRKGFVTLTGEVGTGKTTLINRLLDWLHHRRARTAFLFNSRMNTNQLFDFILNEFDIPCDSKSKSQQLMKLNHWLLDRYRNGETVVLIIDEAQNLTFPVLEEVRLLTNLETSTEKLLQIVLSGQPELEEKLKLPELRQLRQRIMFRCRTAPSNQGRNVSICFGSSEDCRGFGRTGLQSQSAGRHPSLFPGHSARCEFALRTFARECLCGKSASHRTENRGRCGPRIPTGRSGTHCARRLHAARERCL